MRVWTDNAHVTLWGPCYTADSDLCFSCLSHPGSWLRADSGYGEASMHGLRIRAGMYIPALLIITTSESVLWQSKAYSVVCSHTGLRGGGGWKQTRLPVVTCWITCFQIPGTENTQWSRQDYAAYHLCDEIHKWSFQEKKNQEVVEEPGRGGRADGFAESKNVPRLETGGRLKGGLSFVICSEVGVVLKWHGYHFYM